MTFLLLDHQTVQMGLGALPLVDSGQDSKHRRSDSCQGLVVSIGQSFLSWTFSMNKNKADGLSPCQDIVSVVTILLLLACQSFGGHKFSSRINTANPPRESVVGV